jgi:hypothetical protein
MIKKSRIGLASGLVLAGSELSPEASEGIRPIRDK